MANISGNGCTKLSQVNSNPEDCSGFSQKFHTMLDSYNEDHQGFKQCAAVMQDSNFNTLLPAKDMENAKGMEFVNKLKLYLAISGNSLETTTISAKGLQALKGLLVKAGFAEDDINHLTAELQLKSKDGRIKLSDLFNGLPELKTGQSNLKKDDKDKCLLAISALPFIDSIMTALGIPEDLSGKIITDAKEEGRGINLDTLIDGLQKLQKKAFLSGTAFKTDPENNSFNKMMEHMGFPQSNKGISLEDFLGALEHMRNNYKDDGAGLLKTGQDTSNNRQGQTLLSTSGFPQQKHGLKTRSQFAADGMDSHIKSADLLGVFMAGLNNEDAIAKNSGKLGVSAKQNLSPRFMGKGFSKELDSVFSLHSPAKNQAVSGGSTTESELARFIDKVTGFVKSGTNDYQSMYVAKDSAKKNEDMVFDKLDKKALVKSLDSGNALGGAFKEFDLAGKSSGLSRVRTLNGSLPSHVVNQVARGVIRGVYRGDSELRIQLKPPELGRLIVKIDNLGDSMKVSIITDNHTAKDMLASHANTLKAALADSGISIKNFDVSMNNNFNQSMADTGRNPGSNSGSRRHSESSEDVSYKIINKEINTDNFFNNDDGDLHFVA